MFDEFRGLPLTLALFILAFSMVLNCKMALGAVFMNFDSLPVTVPNTTPGNGGGWNYSSDQTNTGSLIGNTCGWYNTQSYPGNPNVHDVFKWYANNYGDTHMGMTTYGYLTIDNQNAISGNSLKITVTGGMGCPNEGTSCGGSGYSVAPVQDGLSLYSYEDYLKLVNSGQDPVYTGGTVGSPYLYFMNNTFSQTGQTNVPFWEAQNTNRLSFYVYLPPGVTNGSGGNNRVQATVEVGPFTFFQQTASTLQGHWYVPFYPQGGGWTHCLVDSHPTGSNAGNHGWTYPGDSLRDLGTPFFNDMVAFYIESSPTGYGTGVSVPPYNLWIDDIEFFNDPEPQNNETINSPSITYYQSTQSFSVGFNDKYTNNPQSHSIYQIRYSFNPITNANWSSATPGLITADSRFDITANISGYFAKWSSYYPGVYAPFTLTPADTAKLKPGTVVYFGIKDVSQGNGNGCTNTNNDCEHPWTKCGFGYYANGVCGRDYVNYPSLFDYAGDRAALPLIKRIDFRIPNPGGKALLKLPPPTNLRLSE